MKMIYRLRGARASVLAAGLALAVMNPGMALAQNRHVDLPTGAVIPVKLNQSLSSKTSRPGDKFTASVRYGPDDAGFPEGTRVEGVVSEAIPSGSGKPGSIDMDFRRIVFPNGQTQPLDGSLISLDGKNVSRSSAGHLVATSDKSKDRLKWVGIGAGAGLLVGTLTKNNGLLSTIFGAGAGYLYNELSNKKVGDVNLNAGTEFGIRLDRQLAFNTNRPVYRAASSDQYANNDRAAQGDSRYYHRSDATDNPPRDTPIREIDRPAQSTGDIGVLIDDRNVPFRSAKPIRRNDTVLIPFDAVAKAANIDYRYEAGERMVYVRNQDLRMGADSRIAMFNGERRRMDAVAEVRNGTLYVPMQFVALAVKGSAYWDAPSKTVVITTRDRNR